jgi:hypothetical protein
LVLLVNDSEYCKSAGAKPIFKSPLLYLSRFPGALCAPTPPRPLFLGRESTKKKNRLKRRGLALEHVGLSVGVMTVAVQCKHHTSEVWVEKKRMDHVV